MCADAHVSCDARSPDVQCSPFIHGPALIGGPGASPREHPRRRDHPARRGRARGRGGDARRIRAGPLRRERMRTAIPGETRCHAKLIVYGTDLQPFAASPAGFNPADLQSAYGLPSKNAGAGATVAIVDAYDDPNAEADLGVYRSQFGMSPCTTASGCFKKVNQSGGTSYPRSNGGWAEEISLDLDMVSAICPSCHILLVEASSASFTNLGTAVNTAAKQAGVVAISNSYGGSESRR